MLWGFPHNSVGKESTCNAGDLGSIPGSGRYTGEGIGYLLQYSWAFLVAQLVQNLPAMRETWVRSLDWEDPLEKGKAAHPSAPGKPPGEGKGCPPQHPWEALAGYFENMFMLSVLTRPPRQLPTVCGLG